MGGEIQHQVRLHPLLGGRRIGHVALRYQNELTHHLPARIAFFIGATGDVRGLTGGAHGQNAFDVNLI